MSLVVTIIAATATVGGVSASKELLGSVYWTCLVVDSLTPL